MEGKRPLGRSKRKWEENIKDYPIETLKKLWLIETDLRG
jgi:hypothetical protein